MEWEGRERGRRGGGRKQNEAIATDNSETKSSDEPLMDHAFHGGGSQIDWYSRHEEGRVAELAE